MSNQRLRQQQSKYSLYGENHIPPGMAQELRGFVRQAHGPNELLCKAESIATSSMVFSSGHQVHRHPYHALQNLFDHRRASRTTTIAVDLS